MSTDIELVSQTEKLYIIKAFKAQHFKDALNYTCFIKPRIMPIKSKLQILTLNYIKAK
jgi:hypothetical protein